MSDVPKIMYGMEEKEIYRHITFDLNHEYTPLELYLVACLVDKEKHPSSYNQEQL